MNYLLEVTHYRNKRTPGDQDKAGVEHPELWSDSTVWDVVKLNKMKNKYRGRWLALYQEGMPSGKRYPWEKSPGVAKGKPCHAPGERHQMHIAFHVFAILLVCSETKPGEER